MSSVRLAGLCLLAAAGPAAADPPDLRVGAAAVELVADDDMVIGGGIQGRTETATLFIFRALDDRQTIGAYSAALVLGLFSLLLVMGTEFLRRRHQH